MPTNDHPRISRIHLLGSLASIVPVVCWLFGILPLWAAVVGLAFAVVWIVFGLPARKPIAQPPLEAQVVADAPRANAVVVPVTSPTDLGAPRYAAVDPAINDSHCPMAYREAFFSVLVGHASHIPGAFEVAKAVRDWVDWQVLNYVQQHPAALNEELRMAYFKKAYEELLAGRIAVEPDTGRRVARWVEQQAMERLRIAVNSF
jgi:hypothetical protein